MPHRIALIAPPWYPVPPNGYGGIELVVALLARELRRAGDEVVLFAADGSSLASRHLAPREWTAQLGSRQERLRELTYAGHVVEALQSLDRVDVIHDHCGFGSLLSAALSNQAPVVHTVHGVIEEAERTFYGSLPSTVAFVAISDAQRSTAPTLPWLGTVHNAVDVDSLLVGRADEKEPYLLCLARISPDKGQHLAIEAARRAGMRLVLAGKVEEGVTSREYFARFVAPAVDGERVIHIGNVTGWDKARLLARAQGLLAPLQWEEPFGLSLAEAMASGTPVIGFPRGAVPELVTPGVTGFLVSDVEAMVQALGQLSLLDPERCAAVARERFAPSLMARRYRAMYARSIAAFEPVTAAAQPPSRVPVLESP